MLIQFTVSNFKSFKTPITLSLVSAKRAELRADNIFRVGKFDLLKSAVLYGANASGKSNFFRAVEFAIKFIKNSSRMQIDEQLEVIPFKLCSSTKNKPSFFEFIFIIGDVRYRYGFEVDDKKVRSEWLFYAPLGREAKLFLRKNDGVDLGVDFSEGEGLFEKTRANGLFLAVVAQFNGEIAKAVFRWFLQCNVLSGVHDKTYMGYTLSKVKDAKFYKKVLEFLKVADLGIEAFNVFEEKTVIDDFEKLPKNISDAINARIEEGKVIKGVEKVIAKIITHHKFYDKDNKVSGLEYFDFGKEESAGTQKIFALSGPILDTLYDGKILFVDELDSRLHPALVEFIIKLFNSNDTNPKNAQLIFASHNTNSLDRKYFRRDQVWFVEKGKYGESNLFSLIDYQVRNTADFSKNYRLGKYGAVPILGDFNLSSREYVE